jgi:hypothetical protein
MTISLALACTSAVLSQERLFLEQYEALIQFYDAVGCTPEDVRCPRFAVDAPCPLASASFLTCEFGLITFM